MAQFWDKFKNMLLGEDDVDDYDEYEEEIDYDNNPNYRHAPSTTFNRDKSERVRGSGQLNVMQGNNSGHITRIDEYKSNTRTADMRLCAPKDLKAARKIVTHIKNDIISIVDLQGLEQPVSQRIADFLSGAVDALDGEILRLNKDMFITAPTWVDISISEVEKELENNGISFSAINW